MSDLLDEIKEDLVREKYAHLWNKFGNYIIGAALLALLFTGAGIMYNRHMDARYESYSDMLYEASVATEAEAMQKYDEIIAGANGAYKAIAGLRKAAMLLQGMKGKEALVVYKKIIDESSAPIEFRELSKLLYVAVSSNLALENSGFQDMDAQKYLKETAEGNNIFKYSALELTAFNEFSSRNYTKAKEIFSNIAESHDAPEGIVNRAREMLDAISNLNEVAQEKNIENKNG